MKRLFAALAYVLALSSCEVDDPKIVTIQNATITAVTVPDTLIFNQNARFTVNYINPSDCHTFEGFDVLGSSQTITIIAETRFEETFECQDTPGDIKSEELDFL